MKKPVKPLRYLVHPSLAETPEVKERAEKGHVVTVDDVFTNYDLVIGPNCYRLSPETIHLLPLAEKSARLTKYGETPKKGKKNVTSESSS